MKGFPGQTVVEELRNAPTPGLAIGFVMIWAGVIVMMFGATLSESSKSPVPTYVAVGGAAVAFLGLLTIIVSWLLLERSWKKKGSS